MRWEVKRRQVKKMEEEREASVRKVIRECAGGGRSVRKFLSLRDRWWENNPECWCLCLNRALNKPTSSPSGENLQYDTERCVPSATDSVCVCVVGQFTKLILLIYERLNLVLPPKKNNCVCKCVFYSPSQSSDLTQLQNCSVTFTRIADSGYSWGTQLLKLCL